MRVLSIHSSLLLALAAHSVNANSINCITINEDLTHIEALAESGKYRNIKEGNNVPNFDYQGSKSYQEYLASARNKINAKNPKASLKCPIETKVTTTLGKPKDELLITDLVAPFELKATNNKQAILLIHGLTDSPYLFHDLAGFYHSKGFNVRTLLLPGHGTAPEALTNIEFEQWQQATKYAIAKTLEDFEQVYLGGFSTGGALILDNLLDTPKSLNKLDKLKGVFLWAPASRAKSPVAWAAQIVDWLPFVDYTNKGPDIDFAKYESFPLNAGAQVHDLMNHLNDKMTNAASIPDIPLLTVTSEVDATINTAATIDLLNIWHNARNRKTQTQDTLFYFGDPTSVSALPESFKKVFPTCNNNEFCSNIIDVAHTSFTNAPSNPHYGWGGSYRSCGRTFGSEHYQTCKTAIKVVLGETTGVNIEKAPSLQRLTFNPNFEQMTQAITAFINETQ